MKKRPKSFSWRDLKSFAFEDAKNPSLVSNSKWCQPFPYDIPHFPVSSSHSSSKNEYKNDSSSFKDSFVPQHLPSYPPAHTYKKANSKKRNVKDIYSTDGDHKDGKPVVKKISAIKHAQESLTKIEDSIDTFAKKN